MSSALFARSAKLTLGVANNPALSSTVAFNDVNAHGLDVTGLDFEFQVEKTNAAKPNSLDLRIYNLAPATRQQIEGGQKVTVQLEVGYEGATTLLWFGEARAGWSFRDGPDVITVIEAGDGENAFRTGRIVASLGARVSVAQALSACVGALGGSITQGNLQQASAILSSRGVVTLNGSALQGSAARRLTDLCRSAGLEWSIQNGAVQILKANTPANPQAVRIAADSGMIGSPTVDSKGIVSVECLMQPGIYPGSVFVLDGEFLKGNYRALRCQYRGQTFGNDWNVAFQGKPFKAV